MRDILKNFLQQYEDNKLVIALVGAILGAILTKSIPTLWNSLRSFVIWLGRIAGGRLAYRDFQKRYLDWVVTEHRELKLTGIVTSDDAKKPKLEQVFVSLHVGKQKDIISISEPNQLFSLRGALPTWRELQEVMALLRGTDNRTYEDINFEIISALSEIKRAKRDYLRKKLFTKLRYISSSIIEEEDRKTREAWLKRNSGLIKGVIGEFQLRLILREHKRVAILGVPGAGKTTLLQYLAITHARERAADPKLRDRGILRKRLGIKRWRLPIFIRLSSIASMLVDIEDKERDPSIVDILPRILPPDLQANDIASKFFTYHLKKGNCLILLDGLDEVPTDKEFHAVIRAIKSLSISYSPNQFVITSRIAGWRSGVNGDFEIFYVNDLSHTQINTFIDTWYSAVERNAVVGRLQDEGEAERKARERRAFKRAQDLKATLRDNIGIRRLATNPMLLSIIAVVHRSLATLPRERSKLYAQCSKILLEQWDISRGVRVDDTNLKLEQKEAIMRRLAVAFHTGEIGDKSGGREASNTEVQRIIASILPSLGRPTEDAIHLLQMLIERSGIIIERQRDILAFAHHTFQEYFTAQHLAIGEHLQHRDFLLRQENILSDWWREVILLYSGLLSDSSDFIHHIYQPPPEDLCQQKLRLAALCLGEAVEIKKIEVRRFIALEVLKVRAQNEARQLKNTLSAELIDYLIQWTKSQQWYSYAAIARVKDIEDTDQQSVIYNQILASLEDQQSLIRSAAVQSLPFIVPSLITEELIDKALARLRDEDDSTRRNAVESLGSFGGITQSQKVVQGLLSLLRDKDVFVVTAVVDALEAMKNAIITTPSVLVTLEHLLCDENSLVREGAAKVSPLFLEQVPPQLAKEFLSKISNIEVELYLSIVGRLKNLSAEININSALTKILDGLTDSDDSSKYIALRVISKLNNDLLSQCSMLDKLIPLLSAKDLLTKQLAIRIISRIAMALPIAHAENMLVELLSNKDINTRIAVFEIIRLLKNIAFSKAIVKKMFDSLKDRHSRVRSATAHALVITSSTEYEATAIQKLIDMTKDSSFNVQVAAINTLRVLNRSNEQTMNAVITALDSNSVMVRIAATDMIAKCEGEFATSDLIEKLLGKLVRVLEERSTWELVNQRIRSLLHRGLRQHSPRVEASKLMNAIAHLGILAKSEMVLDELFRILKQEVWLWEERYYVAAYETTLFESNKWDLRRHTFVSDLDGYYRVYIDPYSRVIMDMSDDYYVSRIEGMSEDRIGDEQSGSSHSTHPLVLLSKQLPIDLVTSKLFNALSDHQARVRVMVLEIIRELKEEIDADLCESKLISALEDKERTVRIAAIDTAVSLYSKTKRESISRAIIKRLNEEETEVQEKAWDALQEINMTAVSAA
jgi:HEAT repeat protein